MFTPQAINKPYNEPIIFNGTPPTVTQLSEYCDYYVGYLATILLRVDYDVSGSGNSKAIFPLPKDCPMPFEKQFSGESNEYTIDYLGTARVLNQPLENLIEASNKGIVVRTTLEKNSFGKYEIHLKFKETSAGSVHINFQYIFGE